MIPAPFEYQRPESINDALAGLAQYGADARVLAGGQSLLLLLKARAIAPKMVIDIGGLTDLRGINRENDAFRIGALARQAELTDNKELRGHFPLLAGDLLLSDPLIRKRGTFAGALAFADPGSDWPAIALALDAQVHVNGVNGPRTLAIDDFFLDSYSTALAPADLLTHVTIPIPQGKPRMVYRRLRHPTSGYALVGVAAVVVCDANGACTDCRVAVTGAGRRAVRARAVELALKGQCLTPDIIGQATEHALDGIDLLSDLHAGADYRKHLVRVYVKRTLSDAIAVF